MDTPSSKSSDKSDQVTLTKEQELAVEDALKQAAIRKKAEAMNRGRSSHQN